MLRKLSPLAISGLTLTMIATASHASPGATPQYLKTPVSNTTALTEEVIHDAALAAHYRVHFPLPGSSLSDYIKTLIPGTLSQEQSFIVYRLADDGEETATRMTLPEGTPVFLSPVTGRAILLRPSGEPLGDAPAVKKGSNPNGLLAIPALAGLLGLGGHGGGGSDGSGSSSAGGSGSGPSLPGDPGGSGTGGSTGGSGSSGSGSSGSTPSLPGGPGGGSTGGSGSGSTGGGSSPAPGQPPSAPKGKPGPPPSDGPGAPGISGPPPIISGPPPSGPPSNPPAVPEPGPLTAFGIGVMGMTFRLLRRRAR